MTLPYNGGSATLDPPYDTQSLKHRDPDMNSREIILSRVREALSDQPRAELPPVPTLWPETNPSTEELVEQFKTAFEAVDGELLRCSDMADAQEKLAALLDEINGEKLGATDRPIIRELLADMSDGEVEWGQRLKKNGILAQLDCSVIEAEYLLADTGTCMAVGGTAHDRLMCYIPPLCVLISTESRLREHMQSIWPDISERTQDPDLRGEFVFITGPSRTADIEKILILGVHGPKRIVLLLLPE